MSSKNSTEVIIAGNVYSISSYESEEKLQKLVAYINTKHSELTGLAGYTKLAPDYQKCLLELNMADDYFSLLEKFESMKAAAESQENEIYNLKHQLITAQMKLEKKK